MNLSVQLAPVNARGLLLQNPVMTASGTFGYGTEYAEFVDVSRLGAVVCKGTTLEPREGNPQPRLKETAAGILNSIGLQNIGVPALIREKAPLWASWTVPVIVNIAGESVEEYAEIASRLDGVPGISALEVNISCPNVRSGGIEFGADARSAAAVTRAVRSATAMPIILKLTPNVTDVTEIAIAVSDHGADAVCLANTFRGMAIDIKCRRPYFSNICGGLSGPAVKPVALFLVYQTAKVVKIPIIGCGGITCAEEALEFIMAGASAVEVGSAQFVDPRTLMKVVEGIKLFMQREGVEDIAELIGAAQF